MYRTRRLVAAVVAATLLVAACGDGDEDEAGAAEVEAAESAEEVESDEDAEPEEEPATTTTTEASTTTTEAPTTTVAVQEADDADDGADDTTADAATREDGFPETPVAAFLSQTYRFGAEQGVPDADQLPFPANTVSVHWYQSDGAYVVVYGGLDSSLALCPGNSIMLPAGFDFISNAPLNNADCSFAPTIAAAPQGVVTCDGYVSYVTLIPAGTEGVLFGTIELMVDGVGVGLTSQAPADPANMPEISRGLIDC